MYFLYFWYIQNYFRTTNEFVDFFIYSSNTYNEINQILSSSTFAQSTKDRDQLSNYVVSDDSTELLQCLERSGCKYY